jgi:hypothetical protein
MVVEEQTQGEQGLGQVWWLARRFTYMLLV